MGDVSFSVDPDQLDLLTRQLQATGSGMSTTADTLAAYGQLELGPDADVWNALQRFHDDWSNGLFMIKDNIGRLVKLLTQAAADYRATDGQIAQAATPQTGPAA
jgi:hypothetical protein